MIYIPFENITRNIIAQILSKSKYFQKSLPKIKKELPT